MDHVRQREESDCAVACLAMMSGRSYEYVARFLDREWERNGLGIERIAARLGELLERPCGRVKRRPYQAWDATPRPENGPAICALRRGTSGPWHAVVYAQGVVFDPEHDRARPFTSFPRRHWHLLGVIGEDAMLAEWRVALRRARKAATQ